MTSPNQLIKVTVCVCVRVVQNRQTPRLIPRTKILSWRTHIIPRRVNTYINSGQVSPPQGSGGPKQCPRVTTGQTVHFWKNIFKKVAECTQFSRNGSAQIRSQTSSIWWEVEVSLCRHGTLVNWTETWQGNGETPTKVNSYVGAGNPYPRWPLSMVPDSVQSKPCISGKIQITKIDGQPPKWVKGSCQAPDFTQVSGSGSKCKGVTVVMVLWQFW